ncbi:MAG: M20/M25/M40 family metallo-hydrolase [Bacteroidia bacterium]|nr:M20/M25/M40 family metallo-hydrolase [Bacteroidia bacterium]
MKYFFLSIFIVCSSLSGFTQQFSKEKAAKHIQYLSSDKLKGRGPGSKGDKLSQKYITRQFQDIGLTPKGTNGYLQPFSYSERVNPHEESGTGGTYSTANVVGYLDNGSKYTIIIGAHFDHLGTDGRHSSLDANPSGKIHNGADDNASGTAGVIELARYFAKNGAKEAYNFLFICFSGEEAGLMGSKYYTENPTIDLKNAHFMINMDMIGRLNEGKTLIVHGVGTSPVFVPLLKNNPGGFTLALDSAGVGPSDHTSFYLKDIPVLFFFTGVHSDYHKPSDDFDKINIQGETDVLAYVAAITDSLCRYPKLTFLKTKTKEAKTSSFKVSLGVMPDYAFSGEGLRIDGVTEGKPAEKAGLKKGDIITKIGTYDIKDIYSYMDALNQFEKGKTTTLTIKRGTEELTMNVTF